MLYTTIKEILDNKPCSLAKVKKLKTFLGDGFTETTPIPLSTVLKSNGLSETYWFYWVLNLTDKGNRLLKRYNLWNAEKVLHIWDKAYPNDNSIRIRLTIEAARKAIENPTEENKRAACIAARNTIYDGAGVGDAYAIYAAAAYTAYVADDDGYAASYTVCVATFAAEATARADTATYNEAYKAFEKEQEAELLRLLEETTP